MTDEKWLHVLRQIDKLDRVGLAGVYKRLTTGATDSSEAFVPGVGLESRQAVLIFWLMCLPQVSSRIDVMVALDAQQNTDGTTGLDALLAMKANADNTWSNGGRPENIGWALDDLLAGMKQKEAAA
jgi:hypothetical protein